MDGSPAIFPLKDGHEMYVKYWDKNCNLQTDRYVFSNEAPKAQEPTDPMQVLLARLDELEKKVDTVVSKPTTKKKPGGEE